MANLKLWGTPNVFSKGYCLLSSPGFEPADMPATNLGNEEPSEVAARSILDPRWSFWSFSFLGVQSNLDAISLVNHNLVPGDYVRFTAFAIGGGTDPGLIRQAPNSIIASDNVTGTISNVDEDIDSPDSSYIGPLTEGTWWATFAWGPLSSVSMRTGTAMAQIVLFMKRFNALATPVIYPRVIVELRENGALVESLGYRALTSTSGQIFVFPFDPSLLADPTGANIEVKVTCERGSDNGSNIEVGKLDAISLYYEDQTLTLNFDSGNIEVPEQGGVDVPTKSIHYIPPSSWSSVVGGQLRILSDQAVKNPLLSSVDSYGVRAGVIESPPNTFIEAGVLCGGEFLGDNITVQPPGVQVAVHTETQESGRTLGGQPFGADVFRYRYAKDVKLSAPRDEKDRILDLLNWQKGLEGAFYIVFEPDVTLERQLFSSFYATLSEDIPPPTELGGWRADNTALYEIVLSVEEKL